MIEEIRKERIEKEELERKRAFLRQRDEWTRLLCPARDPRVGPDRREAMSSRSRSPRISERTGKEETSDIRRVSWEDYLGQDPEFETLASSAKAVIRDSMSSAGAAVSASAAASARVVEAGEYYYVGLARYLRERWCGGERIPPAHAHCNNWGCMHVLAHFSMDAGRWERQMIDFLKKEFGPHSTANKHPGGGGVAASKPNFLYICVLPRKHQALDSR